MRKSRKIGKRIYYVFPFALAWMVRRDGINKPLLITVDKHEAISFATDIAERRESKLIIYGKKGQIIKAISYVKRGRPATKRKLTSQAKV